MAAVDALENFLSTLSSDQKDQRTKHIQGVRAEMSAARSEEARVRIVHEFIQSVLQQSRKSSS